MTISICQKITNPYRKQRKAAKSTFVQKADRKMFAKLTPDLKEYDFKKILVGSCQKKRSTRFYRSYICNMSLFIDTMPLLLTRVYIINKKQFFKHEFALHFICTRNIVGLDILR